MTTARIRATTVAALTALGLAAGIGTSTAGAAGTSATDATAAGSTAARTSAAAAATASAPGASATAGAATTATGATAAALAAGGMLAPLPSSAAPTPLRPVALSAFAPLAGAAAVTPSGYAPLGDVSREEAFSGQETTASAIDRPGRRAALIGALGLGVVGDTPLRAGGSGTLTVSLSRQVDRRTVVRATRVAIRIPANYRTGGVHAPGWSCDPIRARTLRCAERDGTQAGAHAAIRVGLIARTPGRAQVRASASWRQAGRLRRASGTDTFKVRPPLKLRASASKRTLLGDGPGVDSPPLVLTGRLGRYDAGLPVDYRWRQLCDKRTSCPQVRFLSPVSGRASGDVVTAQVAVPVVSRRTLLRFALTARDWRGEARTTAQVVVLPHGVARLASPNRKLRVLPQDDEGEIRRYVSRRRVTRALDVSGSALGGPRPGQRVGLHVHPQGGELQHIRWSIVKGPRATFAGRATTDENISFVVPRGVRSLTIGVRAVVSGRVVRTRETIHITGTHRRASARGPRGRRTPAAGLRGRRTPADPRARRALAFAAARAAADGDRFCALWGATAGGDAGAGTTDAPILLADGSRLTLGGAVTSGAGCDDASATVAFSAGTLRIGQTVFDDVAGTMTPAGVVFTSAWLELPDGWWSDLPPRLRVEPGALGSWGADLRDDAWGPLRAQVDLDDGVELLPLPEGWTFPAGESTLQYAPGTRTFALHSVARAADDQPGSVTLDGSITLDGVTNVTVRADRIVELYGVDDRAVSLSGTGTLQTVKAEDKREAGDAEPDADARADDGPTAVASHYPSGGDSTLTGSITLRTDPADGEIPLTSNVTVSRAVASWDATGISVSTDVHVNSSRGRFEAHASGVFASTSEWRLELTQSQPFDLGDGVTLEDVEGSLERAPLEADDDETETEDEDAADGHARAATSDTFLVSLSGAIRGWSPSDALTDVSVRGAITNACTEDEEGCSTRQVRLAMEVRGNAHVQGQTIPWYGIAGVNLSTFALRFEGGAELAEFGPDALHLSNVRLRLSTNGAAWCRPAAGGAGAAQAVAQPAPRSPATLAGDQELAFSISARGRVLGEPFQADGEFARSGWCLTGAFGEFTPDGLPAGRGRAPMLDEVRIAYASRDADLVVAGRAMRLRAGDVRLSGALNLPPERLPQQLRGVLGGRADVALALTRSGGSYGLSGSALFRFASPVYLMGSAARADEARLGVENVELSFDYSGASNLRLEMAAHGALQTPANQPKGIAASRTPLFLAAGINLGLPSLTLSAGVDTADPSLVDGTVRNAFGQTGLDVRRLLVSASLGADTSIGIAADATLPNSWSSSLGMPDRTNAKVAFSVSQTAPCLELEVGAMPDAAGNPTARAPILRLGPLSANWAQIVVAPVGCTIGNPAPGKPGYKIDPGFAFGFDGALGATPVTFAAALRKTGATDFALRGLVRVGAFDAGPLSFRRTSLDLDIENGGPNRHIDVGFAGGLDAGESFIDVAGRFTANDNQISATLRGRGRLRFADTTFAEGDVDARVEFARTNGSWSARSAEVRARTQILGAEAGLLLSYRDGAVGSAAGAFQYTASVGPLGVRAGVLFAYAPDGVRLDGDPRDCSISRLTPQQNGKELILRLCSSMRLGPLSRDATMTVELPQRWDFDLVVPRSEVGIYVASIYMQGELHASLQIGLQGLRFWVRDGNAQAGGCVSMFWWSKCVNGVDVAFRPTSGRFEGTFLGFDVRWGSDEWRTSPAPAGPAQEQRQIGAGDRVYVAPAERAAVDTRADGRAPWRRNGFVPVRGAVPAGAILDPERRQLTMVLSLPQSARDAAPRPTRGYLLTFEGVPFDGNEPRTTMQAPRGGGQLQPTIAYTSVNVARVPASGASVSQTLTQPGTLALTDGGRRLSWNVATGQFANELGSLTLQAPFNELERELADRTPRLLADGLPLGVALQLTPGPRRAESRSELQRANS